MAGPDAAVFGSAGSWTQASGTMVLTVAGGQTVPNNVNTVVTMTLENKNSAQASQTPTISTAGSATIASTSMSGSILAASILRPTVTSLSPSRIYKSSATTITFSGAGTIATGDKISIRTDCTNAGTELTGGKLFFSLPPSSSFLLLSPFSF